MEHITAYFEAERAESLLFIGIGIAALLIGALVLAGSLARSRPRPWRRSLAGALAFVAVIQLVVGGGIWQRSPRDIERVTQIVQHDRSRIASEEVPRMEVVMRNFVWYRWIELALLGAGLLLIARATSGTAWHGLGIGLVPQAALMLLLDFFAERRGAAYLVWLRSLG